MTQLRRRVRFYTSIGVNALFQPTSMFVLSYPRSGSSWLSRMLASATGVPYGAGCKLAEPQVIHLHRFVLPRLISGRTIYIVRDVRDVVLSYARALTLEIEDGRLSPHSLWQRFGVNMNALDPTHAEFGRFCDRLMATRHASTNWINHVREARRLRLPIIRYEDLSRDTILHLERAVSLLGASRCRDCSWVVAEHEISREQSQGLRVRSGGIEKWRRFAGESWVWELTERARAELTGLNYPMV